MNTNRDSFFDANKFCVERISLKDWNVNCVTHLLAFVKNKTLYFNKLTIDAFTLGICEERSCELFVCVLVLVCNVSSVVFAKSTLSELICECFVLNPYCHSVICIDFVFMCCCLFGDGFSSNQFRDNFHVFLFILFPLGILSCCCCCCCSLIFKSVMR